MKKNLFAILAFAFAVAIAPSCSDEESSSPANQSTFSQVEVSYKIDGTSTTVTEIEGTIYNEVTLSADVDYLIASPVIVGDGGKLNIPAGTTIYAKPQFASYVLVLTGGQIYATGTASAPIEFRSATAGSKWGGLVINGKATISGTAGTVATGSTEINSKYTYGGSNDDDNSGELTYVILTDTGESDGSSVEHNGLTLNGVGRGTKIENIFVDATADDGVEFFGGCVNVTNLLVVNSDDDMFDFTQGYTGTLDNCYGIWESSYSSGEGDPSGVEADGNLDGGGADHINQSDFTIKNMTIVNNSVNTAMADAIMVRRGVTATIENALLIIGSGATVGDVVETYNSKGSATTYSSIAVDVVVNGGTISGVNVASNGVSTNDYSGVSVSRVATSSEGCDTSKFSWTNYNF